MYFVGRIPLKISGVAVPPATSVSLTENVTQKIHKLANGGTARSEGTPEYQFQFSSGILADKQTALEQIKLAKANGEVNISFSIGSSEFTLTDCGISSKSFSSDSDGQADLQISGVSGELLQVG